MGKEDTSAGKGQLQEPLFMLGLVLSCRLLSFLIYLS
jgi:hypothetical protein